MTIKNPIHLAAAEGSVASFLNNKFKYNNILEEMKGCRLIPLKKKSSDVIISAFVNGVSIVIEKCLLEMTGEEIAKVAGD